MLPSTNEDGEQGGTLLCRSLIGTRPIYRDILLTLFTTSPFYMCGMLYRCEPVVSNFKRSLP